MIFEYPYKPVIEDFSRDGLLSYTALVRILCNAANAHSDICGDSVFNIKGMDRAWVLTDWQIEITDYPKYGDELKAETWSEGFTSPLVANRNFLFYKNGEVCARGTTKWILLDLKSGRPSKIDPAYLEKYSTESKVVFEDKKLWRIPSAETWTTEMPIPVRRSDIDFNDHVHNVTYLDYAREVLPQDLFEKKFTRLRISYKTALKQGSTAICRYAQIENAQVVFIYDDEDHLCTQISFE